MSNFIIECACSSTEHTMIIREESNNEIGVYSTYAYLSIHLTKHSFFKRLWFGIKYIFGYQCKYGSFEEVILDNYNTRQLREMLNRWENE